MSDGPVLHLDFESYSEADLIASGAYVYAAHPSTDILCMAWAIDDGPVNLWLPEKDWLGRECGTCAGTGLTYQEWRDNDGPCPNCAGTGEAYGFGLPKELAEAIAAGGRLIAHNASFERLIWRHVGQRRYGFPPIDDGAWWCTAAQAANMGLPRDLDGAAAALGDVPQKDPTGRRIMLSLSRPRKPTKDDPRTRWTPDMAPEKFQHLYEYCRQDVRAERGIDGRLYALSPMERDLFRLDQTINDRGVRIDRPLLGRSGVVVHDAMESLNAQITEVTGGAVQKITQVKKLAEWMRGSGVPVTSLAKAAIAALLAEDDVVRGRGAIPRAADGEIDHIPDSPLLFQDNGGPPLDEDDMLGMPRAVRTALLIRQEAAKSSTAKMKRMLVAAGADDRIRGSLLYCGAVRTRRWSGRLHQPQNFPRGDEIILQDIDGAVAALATGNADIVRMLYGNPMEAVSSCLRAMMIAADGHDLMACDFANIEGRVLAWMAGETWKLDAFRAYDAGTGPDLYKVAYARAYGGAAAGVTKPQRQVGKVMELACGYQGWVGAFQTFAKLYGVKFSDQEAAANAGAWREAHPKVVRLWRDLNDATLRAVARPGVKFEAGPVAYLMANDFLWCRLPSGGTLAYCRPTIEKNDRGEDAVHFWGTNSRTRKWEKQSGYGGLWCENVDQAISRDLLAGAMVRLEAAGYPLVLTVHDELVAEMPHGRGSVAEMEQIAAELPPWAAGLPVTAAGWRSRRYQK